MNLTTDRCRTGVNHTISQSKPARKMPIRPVWAISAHATIPAVDGLVSALDNAKHFQELALPQQLPGAHPRDEGADPQHPASPIPGTLPSCLAPERLEDLDSSFVNSELPHFRQATSSLPPYTSFSNTLPQDVQRNSNMGTMIPPLVMSF